MTSYYQSMMKSYGSSSMMGGPTDHTSYGWMMGGTNAPAGCVMAPFPRP